MRVFKTRTRVRYAETDCSGIVYYNQYFVYFELGRVELFRALQLPYDRRLPIVEAGCRFHASARFDDLLEIHTFVEEIRTRAFRFGHQVHRVRDEATDELELLARGFAAMVHADPGRQGAPMPARFREALESIA